MLSSNRQVFIMGTMHIDHRILWDFTIIILEKGLYRQEFLMKTIITVSLYVAKMNMCCGSIHNSIPIYVM